MKNSAGFDDDDFNPVTREKVVYAEGVVPKTFSSPYPSEENTSLTGLDHFTATSSSSSSTPSKPLYLLAKEVSWTEINEVLTKDPLRARDTDESLNINVFHTLVGKRRAKFPIEMLVYLLKLYPEGAKVQTNDQMRLPLHIACANLTQLEAIENLHTAFPKGATMKCDMGWLPLHYAALAGAEVNVIKRLVEYYPPSVREKTSSRSLPLHYAVKGNASDAVLELLINAYPGGVRDRDQYGMCPADYWNTNHIGFADSKQALLSQLNLMADCAECLSDKIGSCNKKTPSSPGKISWFENFVCW